VEDGGVAGEDRFHQVRLGDVDDLAVIREPHREDVAVAALASGEKAERVAAVGQGLGERRGARPGRELGRAGKRRMGEGGLLHPAQPSQNWLGSQFPSD